jgi:Uma2 family endonuclease
MAGRPDNQEGNPAGKGTKMANVMLAPPKTRTLADLLEHLGGIPPHRVRLYPTPGTATEQDVIDILAHEDRRCELIDGVVVEKPMASYESRVALVIGYFVEDYLVKNDRGIALGEQGMLLLFPHQVRIADVSFISWDQLPDREFPADPIASLYPDLAVEVLSQSNTEKEMKRKLREYFQAGTQLVWLVDPKARTVRVYTSPRKSKLITEDQTLDGGDVLPGFQLPLRKLFARAGRWKGH